MVVLKINKNILDKIINDFKKYEIHTNENYVVNAFKNENIYIKIYQNKNGELKAVFSLKDSLKVAKKYDDTAKEVPKVSNTTPSHFLNLDAQIGSDEVGVGDLFLPLIVVASYITKEDVDYLLKLKIKDSKKYSDEQIKQIVKPLLNKFKFVKYTIDNEKYNELIKKGENANSIKAIYHNYALYLLHKKYRVNNIFIDQFVNEEKYYEYLKDEKYILKNITFKTKAESLYPSVALSSVVARYYLILYREKLNKKYHLVFPYGAGVDADRFALLFKEKYGDDELKKITKNNFKNIKKLF